MSGTSSAKSAEGKRRQRARNKAAGVVSRSGSSGILERIKGVELMSFEEAEAYGVEHVADVMASVVATQLGVDGSATVTLVVPSEWVGAAVDLHRASRATPAMVYLRAYAVGPIDQQRVGEV